VIRFLSDPPVRPSAPPAPNVIEYVAWFRFPVTWGYIRSNAPNVAPLPIKPAAGLAPAPIKLAAADPTLAEPALAAAEGALVIGASESATLDGRSKMVIPKMNRSVAAPPTERSPTPPSPPILSPGPVGPSAVHPPAAPSQPISAAPVGRSSTSSSSPGNVVLPPAEPQVKGPAASPQNPAPVEPTDTNDTASAQYTAPILQLTPETTFLTRFGPQIVLAAVAVLGVGLLLWGYYATGSTSTNVIWSHRFASMPGRLLFLYQPSRGESDYRIEFAWMPNAKGVGWVWRERDESDYYAERLILQKSAPDMVLAEEHFSVFGGVEGPHSQKSISLGRQSGPVQIRMDVVGSAYALSLQGKPMDSWNDSQLTSGAVGFFNETGERPQVQALFVTLNSKGATPTAVGLLP